MNKQLHLTALFCFFFVNLLCAQTGEKKGWTSADRTSFISECVNAAKTSMGADSARFYCYCMQEKVEAKYPNARDADKLTEKEFSSDEWKKEIKNCLNGNWSSAEREEFIKSCTGSAESIGTEKAKKYCECMTYKIEKLYPNAADAGKITEEDLKSPAWQKIIKGCLEF